MHCRNCSAEVSEKAIACPQCGVSPLSERKFCQECGAETKDNQMVCIKCGVKLISKGTGTSFVNNLNLNTASLPNGISIQPNIPAIIVSVFMFISTFLPWYASSASGWGQEFSASVNALKSSWGVIAFIVALASIGLSFVKFKWNFAAGILAVISALIFILDVPEFHGGGYGFEANAGPAWGYFVFMGLSIIYILLQIKTFKES